MLTASRLAEVGDRAQLCVDWLSVEPSIIQIILCFLGVLFLHKFDVYVSDHVFSDILTNVDLLHFSIFSLHLHKNLLVEIVKIALFLIIPLADFIESIRLTDIHYRIVVEVFEHNCWRECRCMMGSGAFVSVAAGSCLEEKRAIDFILLSTID